MTHPHKHRLPELVAEAQAAAANPGHEWDRLAVEWPLTSRSVVYEVGSFKGRWALQIAHRYNPRLFCFEPQEWAYDVTRLALEGYRAQVFNYGLGDTNGIFPMGEWETDGASFLRTAGATGYGQVRDIAEVVNELDTPLIDLMLVNIEGYEHILIPHMLRVGIEPYYLMVQCHDYQEQDRYGELVVALAARYERLWDYGRLLSAWQRKNTDES